MIFAVGVSVAVFMLHVVAACECEAKQLVLGRVRRI